MRKRVLHIAGGVLLAVSVALVIWQGSFTFGEFAPTSIEQTYLFWAVSTLIFLLMVTLGFILFRTAIRIYIERQSNRESSGIKTKMVVGALALSFLPVFFLVLFSVSVLNRNLEKWFSRPAMNVRLNLDEIQGAFEEETRLRAHAQADWVGGLPEIREYAETRIRKVTVFDRICKDYGIFEVSLEQPGARLPVCSMAPDGKRPSRLLEARSVAGDQTFVVVVVEMPADLAAKQEEIRRHIDEYDRLAANRKATRATYLMLLALITLFILFVATWIALFLARQISVPISALLTAAQEVRKGNLGYRIRVRAMDELASLVRAFNEMTQDLQANAQELENRRRFIQAILDNSPTGIISTDSEGRILMTNPALGRILPADVTQRAVRLEDLFPGEDASEFRYLMNRARRTGVTSRQLELRHGEQALHLAVTISVLRAHGSTGFVVVIEDTTDLLHAQKATAWREVAQRIAHELKNPLTPITLSAGRIARQVEGAARSEMLGADMASVLRECSAVIAQEVESVRALVDEFSQLARFPAANPAPSSLNEVVDSALAVFTERLDGITIHKDLADGLPMVNIDREQFKRVVVNLIDNSAEAMKDSLTKRLFVGTRAAGADAVELIVADTGCGVSAADREKLFLPYFSTKGRGTGLGLAIVNQILFEHGAQARVEDNPPAGTRFIVEIPVLAGAEAVMLPMGGAA